MKDNKDIRKISTRSRKEFLIDIKNKFKVGKFETILFLLRSKYSPNKFSKCDLKAKNTEIRFVENLIENDESLPLGDYSLKYSLYTVLFDYIIETISSSLIEEFKKGDIKAIIDDQVLTLYKISHRIRYSLDDIVNELIFETDKKPFFTNILILHTLNELIDEYAYIFNIIRQNKKMLINSYWQRKTVQHLRSALKDRYPFFKEISPAPEFPYLFLEEEYKKFMSDIPKEQNLDYDLIYSPFRFNNELENNKAFFDFKITKRELILLIVLLYEFEILLPINEDQKKQEYTFKDLNYSRNYKDLEVNIDREIVYIIENLCSLNEKKITNVKNELNILRNNFHLYYKSLQSLIEKLNSFNGYKAGKNFLPYKITIKTNEIYRLQNDIPKGPKVFNFNTSMRIAVCLFLGVLDNENITNYFRYDFSGMCSLFEKHSLFQEKVNPRLYVHEIRHEQYNYLKLYQFGMKILNRKIKLLCDIENFEKNIENIKDFKILNFR